MSNFIRCTRRPKLWFQICQSVSNVFLCNLECCFVNLVLPLNLNYLFGILRVTDRSYQKFEEMGSCTFIRKFYTVIKAMAGHPTTFFLKTTVWRNKYPGRLLPCKSDEGAHRKKGKRYQNFVIWACPKFISTSKRYQFNNNKLYNWHCKF